MATLVNSQFPESRKIIFCWDAGVRPKSEMHPFSVKKKMNFQPHKIWSYWKCQTGTTFFWEVIVKSNEE